MEEILLKDLCARSPYKIICTDNRHGDSRVTQIDLDDNTVYYDDFDECGSIKNCKPYLRPLSSMTEEEMDMVEEIMQVDTNRSIIFDFMANGDIAFQKANISIARFGMLIDFLNKQMLDWRGLIQKGLSLEAPKGMYDIKSE